MDATFAKVVKARSLSRSLFGFSRGVHAVIAVKTNTKLVSNSNRYSHGWQD